MNTVLKITNLTKSYGSRIAVSDLSMEVFEGEIFGFLGPNGAGKTTLIKAITGLSKPDRGEVEICGKNLRTDFCGAMRNLGAIIENPDMYLHMSGYENLKFYSAFYDHVGEEDILRSLKMVGMENRAKEKLSRYSLGMKQRLGIAQALLHNPKILILDEPTNGLDPTGIREIRDLFKNLSKYKKMTIFISSHILSEMQLMCDRVGIINHGKLLTVQSMEDLTMNIQSADLTVTVLTDRPTDAQNAIGQRYKIESLTEKKLTLKMKQNELAELNKLLVERGIPVYGFHANEKSLEDIYMQLIGGGDSID